MKYCTTCIHKSYCKGATDKYTVACSRYTIEKGQTNEAWLRSCSTEELAKELDRISMNETSVGNWLWWLKEKHK